MILDAAKPGIPLGIGMFFKDCLFQPMQNYDCVTELVIFFLMGYQSFSQQILHVSRENLSKTPPCVMFFTCKGNVSALFCGRRGGNCKDWDLSREVNHGYCTSHPSSADHFSKLF